MKVSKIAKSFGTEETKLKIDYKKFRKPNQILSKEEEDYIKNDVIIVARALDFLFKQDMTKMTTASNAMNNFKKIFTNNKFRAFFPELDYNLDSELRKSYKGGFTYLNDIYKEREVEEGVVLDVNSLYPSVMYEKLLPYGQPIFYEGKYKDDKIYNLYIQKIKCSFELKENMIPLIQIKNNIRFIGNEYLKSSNNEIIELTVTNIDLNLIKEHYVLKNLEYVCGWKFRSNDTFFKTYIDKWSNEKIKAKQEGNSGMYQLSKLMLNSLYGKFALNPKADTKVAYLNEEGIVKYLKQENENRDTIYLPIGTFITAYGREKTIRTSQNIQDYSIKKYGYSKYCYSDTDSIHTTLSIKELKEFCKIDDFKLGFWKHESSFSKAKFIRQKCYLEMINDEMNIVCSGLPENCYKFVTWDNFKTGFICKGKLTFKHVKRWSFISRNWIYN